MHDLSVMAWLLCFAAFAVMSGCQRQPPGDSAMPVSATAAAAQSHDAKEINMNAAERSDPLVTVRVFNAAGELSEPRQVSKVIRTDEQWREQLTDEQYRITREAGTEARFCGTLLDNKLQGVYACICCRLPLFTSNHKFDSGTGWPSFFQPVAHENVGEKPDHSHGMVRTEIICNRCDAHLGHVFKDGPAPTGLRYCLNSESLFFVEETQLDQLAE